MAILAIFQVLPQPPSFGELPPTLIGLLIAVVMLAMTAAATITMLIVRNMLHDWQLDRQNAIAQRAEQTKALREIAVFMGTVNQTLNLMQSELLKPFVEMVRKTWERERQT